jgi:uncharacterized protein (DUF1778 family)
MPIAHRNTLNMRIKPEDRALFDRAAKIQGKTLTDFVLGSARRAEEEVLLDRVMIRVDGAAYEQFLQRLDNPIRPDERLIRTMRTKASWA